MLVLNDKFNNFMNKSRIIKKNQQWKKKCEEKLFSIFS